MKDYFVDLDKKKRSVPRMIFGVISVVFAVVWLVVNKNDLTFFNIIYSVFFFLSGIGHYYEGAGNYFSIKFFGKSFIELNDEVFKIKLPGRNPLLDFAWGNVKSLKVGLVNIELIDKDDKLHQVDLSKLDYEIVVELKKYLSEKAEKLEPIAA